MASFFLLNFKSMDIVVSENVSFFLICHQTLYLSSKTINSLQKKWFLNIQESFTYFHIKISNESAKQIHLSQN